DFACSSLLLHALFRFFFFQAEDGIRDFHVTGVQTCALPICANWLSPRAASQTVLRSKATERAATPFVVILCAPTRTSTHHYWSRSEERRVGKERRCGWAPRDKKESKVGVDSAHSSVMPRGDV